MRLTRRSYAALLVVGSIPMSWAAGCLSNSPEPNGDTTPDSSMTTQPTTDGAVPDGGGLTPDGAKADGGDGAVTYVLIDDMETTTHGPIELAGITPPLFPGYWYNSGAGVPGDPTQPAVTTIAGDTATPPMRSFTFTALPTPTMTLNGKVSMNAAHQACSLNGQYDVCGIGLEFAQVADLDASAGDASGGDATTTDAAHGDAGDAGNAGDAGQAMDAARDAEAANVGDAADAGDAATGGPRTTVPFDISQYKGITFWGKAALDDAGAGDAGTLDVKVQFPDTETDPRGGVCTSPEAGASGPTDTSQCYSSYAEHMSFTGDWKQYTLMFNDPAFAIDPSFGFQAVSPWDGKKVYGVNWQAQKNTLPAAGPVNVDFWVDDVYFIQ